MKGTESKGPDGVYCDSTLTVIVKTPTKVISVYGLLYPTVIWLEKYLNTPVYSLSLIFLQDSYSVCRFDTGSKQTLDED